MKEQLQVMREPARGSMPPARCACGGIVGPDAECADCKAKRLQRAQSERTVSETVSETAAPKDLGYAFSEVRVDTDQRSAGSVRGPVLQRQPAGGDPHWDSSLLTITLSSDRNDCFGIATPTANDPYSVCGSPVVPPFCQSARVPFWLEFLADRAGRAHPQPSAGRTVTADFEFRTSGGRLTHSRHEKDDNPRYVGPNLSLAPKFGHDFTVGTAESGRLTTVATLVDGATTVRYSDAIDFRITPCT